MPKNEDYVKSRRSGFDCWIPFFYVIQHVMIAETAEYLCIYIENSGPKKLKI